MVGRMIVAIVCISRYRDLPFDIEWWVGTDLDAEKDVKLHLTETAESVYRSEILGWLSAGLALVRSGYKSVPLEMQNGDVKEMWYILPGK